VNFGKRQKQEQVFWFVDYQHLLNALALKVYLVLKTEPKSQTSTFKGLPTYSCPKCKQQFKDAADVFALMSADGSGATCPTCLVPVIEIAAALMPKEENTADFQEELADVIQLLKKVEDMDIPEVDRTILTKLSGREDEQDEDLELSRAKTLLHGRAYGVEVEVVSRGPLPPYPGGPPLLAAKDDQEQLMRSSAARLENPQPPWMAVSTIKQVADCLSQDAMEDEDPFSDEDDALFAPTTRLVDLSGDEEDADMGEEIVDPLVPKPEIYDEDAEGELMGMYYQTLRDYLPMVRLATEVSSEVPRAAEEPTMLMDTKPDLQALQQAAQCNGRANGHHTESKDIVLVSIGERRVPIVHVTQEDLDQMSIDEYRVRNLLIHPLSALSFLLSDWCSVRLSSEQPLRC